MPNSNLDSNDIVTLDYLKLEKIVKSYSSRVVLHSTDLSIQQGEFLCCLGPSGCGKSTLLNIIAGIIKQNAGTIFLNGENITDLAPEKRNCGMVFQNYALFPNLTVEENIAYGLHYKKYSKQDKKERVAELLSLINLQKYEKKYPSELSGGEQQRVALARALAPSPSLLLLDEPLSALDAKIRLHLGEELRRLQQKIGVTTIMVTHDQQEALALADRIVVMDEGSIEQIGTPEDIYQRPASKFVAQFVGNMNFIKLPQDKSKEIAIRYEDVQVHYATEFRLQEKNTFVGRVEDIRYLGNTIRVRILLQDFITEVYADCLRDKKDILGYHNIVAVSLPEVHWQVWDSNA